ncbi:hypothetical protein PVAP13_9KG574600 [Panicum virgatum]|uniref:Uncharacterized protein n=1 Tax=Panicum virgatum TaxID=38727 RepID=A0A8T0NYZ3_PANVG|nr:hypothetical protein PVAP13_9KG574600 [Panicum virgatum]
MIPGLSSEECGNRGSSLPTLPSLRPPPLPTKSRTATPSIPQRPMVIPPRAASRRPRLWRGGASERASRGLSAAADPPSQGAPLAARPPLPRVPGGAAAPAPDSCREVPLFAVAPTPRRPQSFKPLQRSYLMNQRGSKNEMRWSCPSGSVLYKAQSQDEDALVNAAANLHMVLVSSNGNNAGTL